MATTENPVAPAAFVETEVLTLSDRRYLDWSAIFGGAATAIALSMLLTTFGFAIGLHIMSPWTGSGTESSTISLAALVWFAVSLIYAVGTGAYLSGRLRSKAGDAVRSEVRFRDGMNGVVVWAVSLIASAILASAVVSGAVGASARIGSAAVSAAGMLAEASTPVVARAVDELFRRDNLPAAPQTNGTPTPSMPSEPLEFSALQRDELLRIFSTALSDDGMKKSDEAYLARLIENRTGLAPADAEARLEEIASRTSTTVKQAADVARSAAALGGFWMTIVLLLSGVAAWWSASLGGTHRDGAVWPENMSEIN